jgi:dienelactone hydrolase
VSNDLLGQAVELIHTGRKTEAQKILKALIQSNPQDIQNWLWYAEACSTLEQRLKLMEQCVKFNPEDPQVGQILQALRKQVVGEGLPVLPVEEAARNIQENAPVDDVHNEPYVTRSNDPGIPVEAGSVRKSGGPQEYVPQPIFEAPPPVNRTRTLLLWGLFVLLLGVLVWLIVYAFMTTPAYPSPYHYDHPVDYYLYVPKSYAGDREWPLFVGIHGSGGSGLDCWNLWQVYADREGFILLCPSLADSSGGWYQEDGNAKLLAALGQVQQEYRVENRIFLAGFSAGAQFVQGFANQEPQRVKALVILSAGNYYGLNSSLVNTPVLVVIGSLDDPEALSGCDTFVQNLSQNGFHIEYSVLPGVNHAVTGKTKQLTIGFYRTTYGK